MSETAIREAVVAEHLRGLKMPGAAKRAPFMFFLSGRTAVAAAASTGPENYV